jgi:hypothetical protein
MHEHVPVGREYIEDAPPQPKVVQQAADVDRDADVLLRVVGEKVMILRPARRSLQGVR